MLHRRRRQIASGPDIIMLNQPPKPKTTVATVMNVIEKTVSDVEEAGVTARSDGAEGSVTVWQVHLFLDCGRNFVKLDK